MRLTPGLPPAVNLSAVVVLALAAACSDAPERIERQFVALGTVVTVTTFDASQRQFDSAAGDIERHYHRMGREWYPWASGELARLNRKLRRGEALYASPSLHRVLRRAAEIEVITDGLFNAGLGELTEIWGFNVPDQATWQPPDADAIADALAAAAGARALRWAGDNKVSAPASRQQLDLGGIAKGALLNDADAILRRYGIENAIVDIGGDLLVTGNAGNRAARIAIRRPGADTPLGWLSVAADEAVMTSGNYERYFEFDGKRYAHVLDPRTGRPAEGTASVTIVHEDPLLADAAATALLVAGYADFEALAEKLDLKFALLVTSSGDLVLTRGMRERVHFSPDRRPHTATVSQ